MAASGELLPFRRRGSFGRSAELLCLGSLILLINFCAPVSSQAPQAGVLPPEYVLPGGNVTFVKNGDNNLYGNNVTYRSTALPDSAQKCWVDFETPLPAGVLVRFFIYIHSLDSTIDAQSRRLRLQVWRESDPNIPSFLLVWQQRVEVSYTETGALYSFKMDTAVTVKAGDKIGFTNEGSYGPISFMYTERHRTYFSKMNLTNNSAIPVPVFPLTGDVVKFDSTYLPSIYSIAVELDQILPPEMPVLPPEYVLPVFLPPEYVLPGGKVTFFKNSDKNLYGNNVTNRSTVLVDYSQKCWVDYETPLPAGVIVRFFIYIHSLAQTIDAQSRRLRLQIWRESDPNIPSFLLVWQQRVEINYTETGALYSFKMDTTVIVKSGDKIGFTNEGNYGLISFTYTERHRTYLAPVNLTNNSAIPVPVFPLTGDVVKFDQVYLPSTYSIAVELDDPTQPGQTAPQGVTDSNGASGSG